jgi:F1F0 ATPase subunit 2
MTTASPLPVLVFALAAGMAIGLIYFLILWLTLKRLPSSPAPGRLLIFSYLARLCLALAGFYLVMDGRWERVASALAGFVVIRSVLTRWLGKQEPSAGAMYGNTSAEPDQS